MPPTWLSRDTVKEYTSTPTARPSPIGRSSTALSRESRKDLARDYAAADLSHLVSRLETYQERAESLRGEQRQLWGPQALHQRAQETGQSLERARVHVERAAVSVYARPEEATRTLLADPRAMERLSSGQAGAYGELRGRTRDDATRSAAHQHVPHFASALRFHEEARRRSTR
jgi:hypothetical protein